MAGDMPREGVSRRAARMGGTEKNQARGKCIGGKQHVKSGSKKKGRYKRGQGLSVRGREPPRGQNQQFVGEAGASSKGDICPAATAFGGKRLLLGGL